MTSNWFIDAWVLFTVFAALMQSVRTAGQKQLTSSLTPLSSTLVRYVFGCWLKLSPSETLQSAPVLPKPKLFKQQQ